MTITLKERLRGCFWGGAIGDAWGAPLERMSRATIIDKFGEPGLTQPQPNSIITDDTQKLLFTMEAMIFGMKNERMDADSMHIFLRQAYLRWLQTQDELYETSNKKAGFLLSQEAMWQARRGGATTYKSLRHMRDTGEMLPPPSTAKGCGGVMAIAPVGFVYNPEQAFEIGCLGARITHSEPDAYVPSGAMAMLVSFLNSNKSLDKSSQLVSQYLDSDLWAETNTVKLLGLVLEKYKSYKKKPLMKRIDFIEGSLGQGWNGDEAFAIALFSALTASSFDECVTVAVNHTGDSDSTGAIAGNIWGAAYGSSDISTVYRNRLIAHVLINRSWFTFFRAIEDNAV